MAMSKADLVTKLISASGKDLASKAAAARVVDRVFDMIADEVAAGGKVTIVGFGTFEPKARSEHEARNPRTGEVFTAPAKTVPGFRAGKEFKAKVAGGEKA